MLSIMRSKACKRCHGDLSVEADVYGTYIQCLQCGATYSEEEFKEIVEKARQTAVRVSSPPVPNVNR